MQTNKTSGRAVKKGERAKNGLSLRSSPAVFVQLLSRLEKYEYMKIIYVNCGVNSYMKEGHRSYIRILEYLGAINLLGLFDRTNSDLT